jgi:hypothetical protein
MEVAMSLAKGGTKKKQKKKTSLKIRQPIVQVYTTYFKCDIMQPPLYDSGIIHAVIPDTLAGVL